MRRYHFQFIILFLLIFTLSFQRKLMSTSFIINGKITDAETGEPVRFANVFLAKTTVGGMSDNDGNFNFRANLPPGIYQFVIRHIAYELYVTDLNFFTTVSHSWEIKLKPRVLKGRMVIVEANKPLEWEKNLKKFLKMFIGSTSNAKKTRILNPEVLDFKTTPDGAFLAYSDSIIQIENNSLGFDLDIILKDFRSEKGTIRYIIYPQFKEKNANTPEIKQEWASARHQTYKGSFKHFLRSLGANRLKEEGFNLTHSDQIDPWNYTQQWRNRHPGTKTITIFEKAENINITGTLKVRHKSSYPDITASFVILENPAIIDTLGNILNQYSILATGKWSEERIADLLPQDYQFQP